LIANPDRHCGNLSALVHSPTPKLLIFDHSHSLLGYDRAIALNRLAALKDRLGVSGGSVTGENRHCMLDVLKDEIWFSEWIGRIKALPDYAIDDLCTDMRDMGFASDVEAVALRQFLKHRRNRIGELVFNNRNEFTGITQTALQLW